MKLRKLLSGLLAATMILSLSATGVLAANTENTENRPTIQNIHSIIPINAEIEAGPELNESYFASFTGTVKEIGERFISLESTDGQPANISISEDTYVEGDKKIAEGMVITGYFKANAPMMLIYPPQYYPEVVVIEEEGRTVKVDTFNKELVSSDNFLKLNLGEDTQIVGQDGKEYTGELAGKRLVVTYTVSTKSIPAQTTPEKIVVLADKVEATFGSDILVNGNKIEAPNAYINDQGVIMVPVRAVAESLGYDVTWDGTQRSVRIGLGTTLTIDRDYYTYMKTAPIELGTAPKIIDGRTFVPLNFFNEVMRIETAEVNDLQIVINGK